HVTGVQTCALPIFPRECGVLPTRGWLGAYVESDRECSPLLLAFREGAAISWSNTRRKLFGANGGPFRVEPSAGIGANPTRIETAEPTRTGRSAGGASDPARSFGKLPVGDEG